MFSWPVVPRIGIGDFTVSPHGVGIAVGYFVGTWLTARKVRASGLNEDHVWNAAGLGVLGAIVGARAAYVVGHLSEFRSALEWVQIWKGGLSLVGSLIGGFLAGYLYTRRKRIDFFDIADPGMRYLALGIAIGRIGDLVIGDHLGKQTSGWWGWRYPGGELISPPPCTYSTPDGCIQPGMVVHQTALYDLVWSLAIFGILVLLGRRQRRRGFFVLAWACLYAVGRILTDFTRIDPKHWWGLGLTGSQLTAIAVLILCSFMLVRFRGVPAAKAPGDAPEEMPVEWSSLPEREEPRDPAGETSTGPAGGEPASNSPGQQPAVSAPAAPAAPDLPAPEPPPPPERPGAEPEAPPDPQGGAAPAPDPSSGPSGQDGPD